MLFKTDLFSFTNFFVFSIQFLWETMSLPTSKGFRNRDLQVDFCNALYILKRLHKGLILIMPCSNPHGQTRATLLGHAWGLNFEAHIELRYILAFLHHILSSAQQPKLHKILFLPGQKAQHKAPLQLYCLGPKGRQEKKREISSFLFAVIHM